MNYSRLLKRRKQLLELSKEHYKENKDSRKYNMEIDCIDHFFECEGYKTYESIAKHCKESNIDRVIDIGCAYGHQSEVFLNYKINYVGVNDHYLDFWNYNKYDYIVKEYPFEYKGKYFEVNYSDLPISVLCLTWNCYLYNGEETLRKQIETLSRDFRHCLLYMSKDKLDFVKQYFYAYRRLDDGLIYFYNV